MSTPYPPPGTVIEIIQVGVPGPQGPAGAGGSANYVHHQMIASATWTIVHNLGIFPGGILTFDSTGEQIIGHIAYTDGNIVVVTFSASVGGIAYIS